MADLNFPQNPAPGDTYSIGSRTWVWNGSGWALQSGIVSTNPFIVVSAQVTTTTNSTSTNSGALVVAGGGGFGGNIYAANIYSNGEQVVTTGTIGSFGVSAVQAGTDTAVANLLGNVVLVWNTSTLQTVTGRGNSTTNSISVTNTTASTSTNSGALTVAGGAGIGGSVNVGGSVGLPSGYSVNVNSSLLRISSASSATALTLSETGTVTVSHLTASEVYDSNKRVITNVEPVSGNSISVTAISTSNGTTAFTINNTGVTATIGTTYLGVSAATGAVTFTNLGVQSLTGTSGIGVSDSTGTVTLTNLGVTAASGTTYLGVSASTGSITFTNLGVQTLTAGTDTAVTASTGTITVWNTSTLQSVTERGATTNQVVRVTNATGASTTTDGALVVTGGVGIGQNLWVGGTANIVGRTTFSDAVVFNGTATFVLSTNTVYTDNILELHTTSSNVAWTFDDGKDIGLRFRYFNRTLNTGTNAALVLSNNAQFLEWYSAGAEGDNVFTGTQYGVFRTGEIRLTSTASNIATANSGALQVQGGVGVAGTQYISGIGGIGNNTAVLQQSLIVAAGGLGVNGNSYFANALGVNGNFNVTGTSVLSGQVSANSLSVATNFTATGASTLNGAVTANSSLGVQGNFNVTGTSVLTGNVTATNDLSVSGNFAVTGTSVLTGITRINNGTNSADTGSGALVVAGGAGFGGNVNVGGNIFVAGVINATVVGSIDTATNVTGGTAGAILVQTDFGRTSFINPGAAGTILTSNGTGQQPAYQNTLTLAGNTNASSTNSGALQVVGGVGIGRDAWIGGNLYVSGNQVVTTGTIGGLANLTIITAGTDTAVSTSTGNVTIWNTSTLASVTARSGITPTALVFENQTQSTSTNSGALTISGGLGVGKNVTIGENLTVFGTINFQGQGGASIDGNTGTFGWVIVTGTGTGLTVDGSAVIGNNLTATTINVTGRSTLQNVSAATLTATNLIVTSNQTINGDLRVAGNSYTTGTSQLTGNVYAGSNVGIQGNLSTTGTTTLIGSVYANSNVGINGDLAVTGTTVLSGVTASSLGVSGNVNVTGTTVLSTLTVTNTLNVGSTTTFTKSIIVGPVSQYKSYESITTSTIDRLVIDVFDSTFYRTVKYLVQVVDTGYTPHRVQVEEFLVFHDNNGASTAVEIIQYAVGSNLGALGEFDAAHSAGEITIYFDPAFTPTNLTVKTVRTAVTV
jgi:fibronectin-binding autotransporter adhesin